MPSRERVVVVGASGFGRESLDVLGAMITAGSDFEILGVVDDDPSEVNLSRLQHRGVAYLGTIADWLASGPLDALFVLGIGNSTIRRKLVLRLEGANLSAFTAVHPNATIGACTTMAEGVVVCAGAAISTNVTIGRYVQINPNATVGHDADLRDFVSVNPGAVISGEVLLNSEVLIGASATVLQQLTVGAATVVGAGALVTKDVPESVVVKGVPGVWRD